MRKMFCEVENANVFQVKKPPAWVKKAITYPTSANSEVFNAVWNQQTFWYYFGGCNVG